MWQLAWLALASLFQPAKENHDHFIPLGYIVVGDQDSLRSDYLLTSVTFWSVDSVQLLPLQFIQINSEQCQSVGLSVRSLLSPQAHDRNTCCPYFKPHPRPFDDVEPKGQRRQRTLRVLPRHRASLIHVCLRGDLKLLHVGLCLMALTSCPADRSIGGGRGHPSAEETKAVHYED